MIKRIILSIQYVMFAVMQATPATYCALDGAGFTDIVQVKNEKATKQGWWVRS